MQCRACGRESSPENAFCGGCGAALAARPPRDYTPRHLAERILRGRSALEGERKQVTVLFADVKDSTALAEQLDPEQWHGILDGFFAILTEGIHRFEGTVNQFTGDGVMALFGAPIAHEDHARRACYAALQVGERLADFCDELGRRGIDLGIRIGLHSGEVVVGKIGDDLRMDYTAQGATVSLAARIEEEAPPGQIWVSADTARRVEGLVDLRDVGTHSLRGIREPAQLFALEGIRPERTAFDQARARGLTRLVGRQHALSRLEAILARARPGEGSVVGMTGEPGVGKSRLCFELAERCRAERITLFTASCPSHGRLLPLLPIRTLLRRCFAVARDDEPDVARQKVAHQLDQLGIAFVGALPLVFDLLQIADPGAAPLPLDEQGKLERQLDFVRRLVQTLSADETVVFVLEDVHWIDAESARFVTAMIEALGWTRTLLVLTSRVELPAEWLAPSYAESLRVEPLPPSDSDALVRELLGDEPATAELRERIAERTRGNPFFVEEVVRDLRRRGDASALPVPESVQAVLAARIDALGEAEKQVLQAAAVIGRRFERDVLARVVALPDSTLEAALGALAADGLLQDDAFVHPLAQEVAYASQLAKHRRSTHSEVARALEELRAEDLGRHATLIAHHWQAAGKPWIANRWRRRAALKVSRIQLRGRGRPDPDPDSRP